MVAAINGTCGLTVNVLSGDEEARLAFVGAARTLDHSPGGPLGVVDVGGGSSELVVGTVPDSVSWSTSFGVGSGELTDACLSSDPPSSDELAAAKQRVRTAFSGVTVPHPVEAVAVGGSATSLRRLAGPLLDADAFKRALGLLGGAPRAQVAREFALDLERVRLLPAGLLILQAASELFGAPLQIARGGVREGVLLEAAGSMSTPEPPLPPREALADIRVRAPTRGNRRLERLLEAVNADAQVKAWWHVAGVNASRRLVMSDHSWVHIQVVLNIGLRLARLLFRRGVTPSVVADYAMTERDAEVVVAAGCLLHCVGMSIHRNDHERFSLFLTADKLGSLLETAYEEPERSIIVSETLHAIIGHRSDGAPFTIEAGIVRVADALDMARGRSRMEFETGHQNIYSLSAYAIEEVKIRPGRDRAVLVEIAMSNSAGIFQVDELLATKLRGSGLEQHIEVVARIDAEHEQRLIRVFRI